MQKCENCRWNIPDDISSCPYCGHLFHPDSQEEEERRKRLLRWHMLNVMRQKKHYVPLSTVASAAAAESLLPKATGLPAVSWAGLPAVKVILVVVASLVLVTGSVSALIAIMHRPPIVIMPTATPTPPGKGITATATQNPPTPTPTPSPSACANSPILPTPGAGNGTDLTFTFSGVAPSLMCVVRNDGCVISGRTYNFHVLGTINGKLYTFIFITAAYTGPGTYTNNAVVALNTGDHLGLSEGNQAWRAPFTGTETVNSDEKSGSVNALMNQNINTSGTVQVTGTWSCSVGLGQPR